MEVTPALVAREREWVLGQTDRTVSLINEVRVELRSAFDTDVDRVTVSEYTEAVGAVFADGDLAVNVATLVAILRDLDVESDYHGFIVDEHLGRSLAGMIAGGQPLQMLAEATFHFADLQIDGGPAGTDDLHAGLAAGFQTRLPGWDWTGEPSPFAIER